jgi:hypothetical protein
MTTEVKKDEDWMQKKWRPAMGWMYMVVCFCDMVLFPVAWSILQAVLHQPVTQWNPLTLQGAGLFHLAMGAVLGIAAWGRTQEKVAGAANNEPPKTSLPSSVPSTSSFSAPATTSAPSFGGSFGSTPSTFTVESTPFTPSVGFGGKLAPPAAPQPEL